MSGGWWVHSVYESGGAVPLLSHVFWVILSITLHELAHGWAAIWQGDDTPRRLGHMTANPMVHMGPWSLVFFAIAGLAWGLMPVEPGRFRWGRRGRIFVSGAGPAMNVALALVTLTLLAVWIRVGPADTDAYENIITFLWTGGWLNVLLALFNLLPIPPLDGSSILSGLSLRIYQFYHQPQAQIFGMFILLAIIMTGCGSAVVGASQGVAAWYVGVLGLLLGDGAAG